jgi:hypothetical protein
MTRRLEAVARLELSRQRLQRAMVGDGATGSASATLLQLVRRHPLASAAAAAVLGALLARMRPWRWALQPALWSALLPGLLARLAGAPASSWSGLLATFMQEMAAAGMAGQETQAEPGAAAAPASAPAQPPG